LGKVLPGRIKALLYTLLSGLGLTVFTLAIVPMLGVAIYNVPAAREYGLIQATAYATMPTFTETTTFVVGVLADYWVYAVAGAVLSGAIVLAKRAMRFGR